MYTVKWKDFFPRKEMMYPPYFDARAVCYPSSKILRDYLAWRQVDCEFAIFGFSTWLEGYLPTVGLWVISALLQWL